MVIDVKIYHLQICYHMKKVTVTHTHTEWGGAIGAEVARRP